MYDTEWEHIANKFLDKLDGNSSSDDERSKLPANTSTNEAVVSSTKQDVNSITKSFGYDDGLHVVDYSTEIEKIDPKLTLVIYRYLKTPQEDIIVAEYCDKLLKLNFVPNEPSDMEMMYLANCAHEFNLSDKCKELCVSMLVAYFKCCELQRKLKLAEIERASLFNFDTPQLMESQLLFTITGHERFATLRHCLAIQTQRAALIENQFAMELLLIRVCYAIMEDLKQNQILKVEATDIIRKIFMNLFIAVKHHYMLEPKQNSDTCTLEPDEEYNTAIFPTWRLEAKDPPMYFEMNITSKICDKIKNSENVTFDVAQALEKKAQIMN